MIVMYGERLKELAKAKGLNQKDLAKIAKAPDSSVSRWINHQYPPLKFIESICRHVNTPLWMFFLDNPSEIANHPINQIDELDLEILTAIKNLDKKTHDQVLHAFRDILQALVEAKERS